ncbi:MAG: acetyl-CoA carboxylase biotin carboxyl carrier protein [Verrucomicrobiota bacterium]
MELKDIKELIALIRKNDLSEFSLEQEGFKITLKRGAEYTPVISTAHSLPAAPVALPAAVGAPAPAAAPAAAAAQDGKDIPSPMVGTFYAAASPESSPFVAIGQQVTADTTICIIEAMKVMNEIKAETSGTIVEILAENGKPVQYGQALFRIR